MKRRIVSVILALLMMSGVTAVAISCEYGAGGDTESESGTLPEETVDSTDESGEGASESQSIGTSADTDESESDDQSTACEHPYDANIDGHWKPACDVCGKAEGRLMQHEFLERVEDEGDLWYYTNYCKVCNYAPFGQEVPYEINSFYSAGEISSRLETSGSLKPKYDFRAGVGYAKFASASGGGNVSISVLKGAEPTFPSGKYLVMKVKIGASQKNFSASIASSAADASYTMTFRRELI